tara:strand:- start:13894 stop:17391 length:3498 start_codon:yes stop_codon:yes gene_type:complete
MTRFALRSLAVVAVWLAVAAWDTRVIEVFPWQSIYQEADGLSLPEHTSVTDETFDYLDASGGLRGLFGRGGSATIDVVDLNASHFRPTLRGVEVFGDDAATESEERTIPPPGMFSGLPDYSYGVYDWLNKNTTCPAFADGNYAWRCHEFMGWLGALNSVHFGTQARDMYAHQHRNALALAERARLMREAMTEAEREVYDEELREAELLALAYEGYAQHFLQDRWAIGHMWERWAAPDPQQQDESLPAYLAIGALAGIIHGSEALVSQYSFLEVLLMRADPMSSPLPGPGRAALPMHYRHVRANGEGPPVPAVGDERFQDALVGQFSLNRYQAGASNQSMNVQTQMDSMFECAGAGWAETIRALGQGEDGYGVYGAQISDSAPDFSVLETDDCWNMWATNESMMIGLLGPDAGRSVALIAAVDFVIPDLGPDVSASSEGVVVGSRTEFVAYATRLWMYGRDNPNGTEIARGEMTSYAQSLGSLFGVEDSLNPNTLWGFREGGDYVLPDYAEPVGLITEGGGRQAVLPESDSRGRDIQTLYGAFNGAQSDYWCENRDLLADLRSTPSPINRELCEHLANRMYEGSHPAYEGVQSTRRELEGAPVRSICRIRNTDGVESNEYDDADNPFWLAPGYFPANADRQTIEPSHTNFDAVANWCARVPVLTLIGSSDMQNDNIVAQLSEDDSELVLVGRDLGDSGGTITLESLGGTEIALTDITAWTDNEIRVDVSSVGWEDGEDYVVSLTPDPTGDPWERGAAPGLFVIRIREPVEIETVRMDLGGVGPCRDAVPDFALIDLSNAVDSADSIDQFATLADSFSEDLEPIRAYFTEQLRCMQDLRATGLPVHRRAERSFISAIYSEQPPYSAQVLPFPILVLDQLVADPSHDPDSSMPWEDYYTTYMEVLEGTIWYLDHVDNFVQAWAEAVSGDTRLMRTAVPLYEIIPQSTSIDAALQIGFQEGTGFVQSDMPADIAVQLNAAHDSLSISLLRADISLLGNDTQLLVTETLRGLPAWMQVQHTLTHDAIPDIERVIIQLQQEVDAEFLAYVSSVPPGDCARYGGSYCEYYPDINLDEYSELGHWISQIAQGSIVFSVPDFMFLTGTFLTPEGDQRNFRAWPADDAAEIARNGPGAISDLPAGPAGLEPIEFDFDPPAPDLTMPDPAPATPNK